MGSLIDLTGRRFGKRVVIRREYLPGEAGKTHWLVRCDCGREDVVQGGHLRRGERAQQCRDCQGLARRQEIPRYLRAHDRVRRARGNASDYPCVECAAGAREWALMHETTERLTGECNGVVMEYSRNVDDYQPMCTRCHRRYDADHRAAEEARRG
jgi:hypothetical protein